MIRPLAPAMILSYIGANMPQIKRAIKPSAIIKTISVDLLILLPLYHVTML